MKAKKLKAKSSEFKGITEEQQIDLARLLNVLEETVTRGHTHVKLLQKDTEDAFKNIRNVLDATIDKTQPRAGEYWLIQLGRDEARCVVSVHCCGSAKRVFITGDEEGIPADRVYKFIRKIDTGD